MEHGQDHTEERKGVSEEMPTATHSKATRAAVVDRAPEPDVFSVYISDEEDCREWSWLQEQFPHFKKSVLGRLAVLALVDLAKAGKLDPRTMKPIGL